jgi:hypothetical protein
VTLDGDRATTYTPFLFFRDTTGSKELVAAGRYFDTLERTDAGWRLARREAATG